MLQQEALIPEGLKDIPFDGYVLCDGHYIIYNNEILVDEVLTTPEIQKTNGSLSKISRATYVLWTSWRMV